MDSTLKKPPEVLVDSKICSKCSLPKPLTEFFKNRDRLRSECKDCNYLNHPPEKSRNAHLKRTYGITTDDYNSMFAKQEGHCLGCDRHQSELKQKLHVDHCHKTNEVRGLLCFNCNQALGNVSDSINRLNSLIDYLRSFG